MRTRTVRCTHSDAPRAPKTWKYGESTCIDCARKRRRAAHQRYLDTPKGKAKRKQYAESAEGKASHAAATARYRQRMIAAKDPLYRFSKHKAHSRKRGIPFLLTFHQWWRLWRAHWQKRGRIRGQLVMARKGDTGPYAVGNVEIVTNAENNIQAISNGRRRSRVDSRVGSVAA